VSEACSPESRPSFDPVWDAIYAGGQANRYPWDVVVSFVYRHRPGGRPHAEVAVLEIGCGTGSNLWFAAREGFRVAGIDASAAAIGYARKRFAEEGLAGDLRVGDFTALPFADAGFDLAIDRGALTCAGRSAAARAIAEVRRVLRPGGAFFSNLYSTAHSSRAAGRPGPDGLTLDIRGGSVAGVGQICFYDREAVAAQFPPAEWEILSLSHLAVEELQGSDAGAMHAEWRLVARRR
jgi:SAM-dependent methyltransferase